MRIVLLLCALLLTAGCSAGAPPASPLPSPEPAPVPSPRENIHNNQETNSQTIVLLSYEARGYVKQVTGTETKTMQIGDYEESSTETGVLIVACVEVTNTDTEAGQFTVKFVGIAVPTFGDISLERVLELTPGQTGVAECPADELGNWSYTVTPSEKTM
jgi:hypothetical protein